MGNIGGCCGSDGYYEDDIKGACPDCGGHIDEDGRALEVCYYSPEECDTCGWKPCDGSC